MYTYIIKKKTGEILSVNRTTHGTAMELYGLDVTEISGKEADEETLVQALSVSASVECKTSENNTYTIERHFLGN